MSEGKNKRLRQQREFASDLKRNLKEKSKMENITTINAADLAKLRDQLNLKLGAYNEAVKNNKIAANEIKNTLQQINEDHLKVLHEFDINTDELFNIDIEALTTNEEYLQNKLQTLSSAYQKIDESVRKQLGL